MTFTMNELKYIIFGMFIFMPVLWIFGSLVKKQVAKSAQQNKEHAAKIRRMLEEDLGPQV